MEHLNRLPTATERRTGGGRGDMGRQEKDVCGEEWKRGAETNGKTRKWKGKGVERVGEGGEGGEGGDETEQGDGGTTEMNQGVEWSGSAAHLEVQQFNTRSNEEVRLHVSEHRERKECSSSHGNHMWNVK